MSKKNKQGIVIGTKEEALWTKVKEATEARILAMEDSLIVEKEMLKIAKIKVVPEKRK